VPGCAEPRPREAPRARALRAVGRCRRPRARGVRAGGRHIASKEKEKIAEAEEEADAGAQAALLAKISKDADVLLEIHDEDRELLGEFQTEALEHLENIEASVLVLENNPRDGDSLALIFRAFHTIKGVAGFLHLVPIQSLAHEVESLLDPRAQPQADAQFEHDHVILQAKDTIQALVDQITKALQTGEQPTEIVAVSHLIVAVQLAAQEGLDVAAGRVPAASQARVDPLRAAPRPPPPRLRPRPRRREQGRRARGRG
jgi:two-component system chemotaxis sensor kinase CheA